MLHLRASSLADTHAIAAALAGLSRAGDLIVLAGEMGAGKTAFAKGFGAALGVTEPITSPTFTLVHSYEAGSITLHHADIYRLSTHNEVADLALAELLEYDGIVLLEWGDVVAQSLGDHLLVHLDADRRRRRTRADHARRHRPLVGGALGRAVEAATGGVRMLILGIETATQQVSVAIGGHEGVLGMFEVSRGRRHAETLAPAIEFLCRQADIEIAEFGAIAVDVGPGPVHRHARRAGRGQGHRPGAARADDRHQLARPAGVPAALRRPHHRGGHRRPQGRGVLRVLPPGARAACSGSPSRGSGRSTTSSPT